MKVDVYRNLHNGMYSIKARTGKHRGRVIAHAKAVWLDDVEFVVSEAGRARVLREKKKYVHAFVRGTLSTFIKASRKNRIEYSEFLDAGIGSGVSCEPKFNAMSEHGEEFTYNPYRFSTFVDRETESELHDAAHAFLCINRGTKYLP